LERAPVSSSSCQRSSPFGAARYMTTFRTQFLDGSVKIQSFRQRKIKGLTHPLCYAVRISCLASASSDAWLRSSIPSSPIAICHLWSSHERRRVQSYFATADFARLYMWRSRAGSILKQTLAPKVYVLNSNQQRRERQKTCSGLCVAPVALNDESCCPETSDERFR